MAPGNMSLAGNPVEPPDGHRLIVMCAHLPQSVHQPLSSRRRGWSAGLSDTRKIRRATDGARR